MKKTLLWYLALAVIFGVLVVAFGYLDEELNEVRRWSGCAMLVAGIAIVVPAARRLASDWPRLKPVHSVDLAFVQIAVGIVVLCVACLLGGRPEAFLKPIFEPTPKMVNPSDQPPANQGG